MTTNVVERDVLRWNIMHAVLMLLSLVSVIAGLPITVPVVVVWISLISFLYLLRAHWSGSRFLVGAANSITLSRLALLSIVSLLYPLPSPVLCGWLLIVILCLDGIDGLVARRYAESSVVGQHLDVEVDAFAIALMSLLLWQKLGLSVVFVLAGSLRYCYVLVIKYAVRVERTEPKRPYASLIAVLVYISMVLELAFHHTLSYWLLVCGVTLLSGSFTRSFIYQWQDRGRSI